MQAILFVLFFIFIFGVKSLSDFKVAKEDRAFNLFEKSEEERRYDILLLQAERDMFKARGQHKPEREGERVKASGERKKSKEKRFRSIDFDDLLPPENSRFNLWLALDEKGSPHYASFARLLRLLYGKSRLFQERPNLEYQVIDALIREKERIKFFKNVDELATLSFEEPFQSEVFYPLLKGMGGTPSLLWYIALKPMKTRVNLLFAPEEILLAMLNNSNAVNEILRFRSAMKMRMCEEAQKAGDTSTFLTRTSFTEKFTEECQAIFLKENIPLDALKWFDFHVGKEGDILYLIDPETGNKIRKRLLN